MQLIFEIIGGFCGWVLMTGLQLLFGCLHPTRDPRVMRLKRLGVGLLSLGLLGIVASFAIGGKFGFVWFAATFAGAILTLGVAATIGGFLEAAIHDKGE